MDEQRQWEEDQCYEELNDYYCWLHHEDSHFYSFFWEWFDRLKEQDCAGNREHQT